MLMCVGLALRHSLSRIIRLYMALGVTKVTAARSLCDYWLGELVTTSPGVWVEGRELVYTALSVRDVNTVMNGGAGY